MIFILLDYNEMHKKQTRWSIFLFLDEPTMKFRIIINILPKFRIIIILPTDLPGIILLTAFTTDN